MSEETVTPWETGASARVAGVVEVEILEGKRSLGWVEQSIADAIVRDHARAALVPKLVAALEAAEVALNRVANGDDAAVFFARAALREARGEPCRDGRGGQRP